MKILNISCDSDELDFLDTDTQMKILYETREKEKIIYINKNLNDIWSKNVPKWLLHYHRTGELGIRFKGVTSMIVKLNDVTKTNEYKFKKQVNEKKKKDKNKLGVNIYKKLGIIKNDNLSKNYKIKKL